MAIIYTYPKLQNPQGNELIVVSDVNNKNATRLITIADLASCLPSGDGCQSAITGILTGSGSYIPTLCADATFVGLGVNIEADQATGVVTFTVPPPTIPCASQDGDIGGVAVAPGNLPTPTASATGSVYPIQVTDDCLAAVRIPDSQGSGGTVTSVGATTGGNSLAVAGSPIINSGTLAFTWNGNSTQYVNGEGNLVAFPAIPPQPTVNNGVLTITVDGSPTTFSANQAGNSNVTINTGGTGSGSNGFTPMSIYDSDNIIPANVVSIFVQTVVEDTCQINKVDFASYGAVAPNDTVFGLYRGRLADAGNTVYLGGGTLSGAAAGEFIYTIDLVPPGGSPGDTIDITAGDDIVIFYSRAAGNGFHIGKGQVNGFSNDAIAQKIGTPQIQEGALNTDVQAILSQAVGAVSNQQVPRIACHFYKGTVTPPPEDQIFVYQKCNDADSETCGLMPPTVTLEDDPANLLQFLIIQEDATGYQCCYTKEEVGVTPSPGFSIVGTFNSCDELPVPTCATKDDGGVVEEEGEEEEG